MTTLSDIVSDIGLFVDSNERELNIFFRVSKIKCRSWKQEKKRTKDHYNDDIINLTYFSFLNTMTIYDDGHYSLAYLDTIKLTWTKNKSSSQKKKRSKAY